MSRVIFSFDDGAKADLKTAEILNKHNLKGIFFIPVYVINQKDLKKFDQGVSVEDIKNLVKQGHEIGNHTFNHPKLSTLSNEEQLKEIKSGKEKLEEITGKKIYSFAYPYGTKDSFNNISKEIVKKTKHKCARTTVLDWEKMDKPKDNYEWNPTLPIAVPRATIGTDFIFTIKKNFPKISLFSLILKSRSFIGRAKIMIEIAKKYDKIIHFWSHSWTIEKQKLWSDFDKVCKLISKYKIKNITSLELF